MYHFYIIRICNRHTYLLNDLSGIYLMLQKESRNPGFRITVDNRPVDRSSSTILRKTAASWFGACIFLIVAATILRSFFL